MPARITGRGVRRKPSALMASVLAIAAAGCASAPIGPVTINTAAAPDTFCEAASVGGVLAYDTTYGLGFKAGDHIRVVVWPYGYSARRDEDGVVILIDPSGRVVAREGDQIVAAGALADTATYVECDLQVNPSPAP